MDKAVSIFIDVFTKNPLTVTLAILGVLCIALAIIGRIPPMEVTGVRQVILGSFGFVLIVVAIGLAWILTPSQPLLQPTTVTQGQPTQPPATVSFPSPAPASTATGMPLPTLPSTATNVPLPTPRSVPTVQVPPTPAPIQMEGPFREHRAAAAGTGVFTQVTSSDGRASFSQDDLNTNHYRIQRIRPEENPDGCGTSIYTTDKVWFGSSANTIFTVNGKEVGRLSVDTGRHGYIANWSVRVGDRLCAVGFAPSGYHVVMGPDLYYHYDSYCYRGNC